ncbi:MAG TPA: hypothetical protein VJB08_03885 [Candidatus Nanoarchaeia archaeon]|nr:hypothetical protein [Candidatus Nanoarchaeia archaeon]
MISIYTDDGPDTCAYCGTLIDPEERQCPNCGENVSEGNMDLY